MISSALPPGLDRVEETTVKYVRHDPITFDEFLGMFGPKDFVELVDGCVMEKPMVQWKHEDLLIWVTRLAGNYVEDHELGVVAGSRTAVKISPLGSRLPDFLFVSKDRLSIIHEKAIMEAPNLVIEVRSPSTTGSEVVALESDYMSIGVAEIILIDPERRRVRANRLQSGSYAAEELTEGELRLAQIPGFRLDLQWLFDSPRPTVREALTAMEQAP
jgi:Uma2 family endonuclease